MLKYLLITLVLAAVGHAAFLTATAQTGRIVGGTPADIRTLPYQVSLQISNCDGCLSNHFCGGTITGGKEVVTAAHCVYGRSVSNLYVVAGTNYKDGSGGIKVKVQSTKIHDSYNSWSLRHDIAKLYLATDLQLDNVTRKAIQLPEQESAAGTIATVSGWGTTSAGGIPSDVLLAVNVPIVSKEECSKNYGPGLIFIDMICAGELNGGKDSCQGDSGGPLSVAGIFTGIVSWGCSCALKGYPGVYTDVNYYKSFILEQ